METRVSELLPIGSVVRLIGGKKALMIYGVRQTNFETNEEYDYISVLYPEGTLGANSQFLFQHKDIEEVLFMGFETEASREFRKKLAEYYDE